LEAIMRFAQKWTKCTVDVTRDVTSTVREIVLRPEGAGTEPYAIGGHVNVGVLIDGRPETRCYSLVGDFNPAGYRIAVRLAPDSRGGSRYMWTLKPGARVEISSPASLLEIDWSKKSYCLIAGGIGITPMLGIAGALIRRNADIAFHYAVKSRAEAAFLDELSGLLGDRLIVHAGAARCACSKPHVVAGRRRGARRPTCDTRRLARAVCCRRHHFGFGSIIPGGKSWSPRINRCWMRSMRPALR
jgi:ferredoxin-NADP reductase